MKLFLWLCITFLGGVLGWFDAKNRTVMGINASLLLWLFLFALFAIGLTGCTANAPYYVSGAYVGVADTDTSKDGVVGVTISPNPYAHLAKPSPK